MKRFLSTNLILSMVLMAPAVTAAEDDAGATRAREALASAETPPGLSRPATKRIEEIVVSARKRDELIEDTPVSITALSADTLRESGVTRLSDIQDLVPNLEFRQGRDGLTAGVSIRGIGTATPELAFDPGVGIYIDGVYLPRALGSIVDVLDVAQIEVLRGPQGTLFGKNTVGGAINMTTVKPHEEPEAFALLRAGNFGLFSSEAMLNVPIVEDWLLSRISFSSTNTDGYFENTAQSFHSSNRNSLAFLGSLRLLPHEDVVIDVSGSWARSRNHSQGAQCRFEGGGSLESLFSPALQEACDESEPLRGATNVRPEAHLESYGMWGTATWSAGETGPLDDLSVKALGSWRTQKPRVQEDVDGTPVSVVQISDLGGGDPLSGSPGYQEQYSGELQVNAEAWDERLHIVGGYFALWETARNGRVTTTGPTPGQTNPLRVSQATTTIDNWTWALYAQATADVTEWMSLTAGLRYTEDKKGSTLRITDPRFLDQPASADSQGRAIFTRFTPMGSLALTVPEHLLDDIAIDHLMGYFTYAQGFRGGGFNALSAGTDDLAPFGPELLDNFEVGLKTIALDQRLTFNLSAFYGIYDDIQVVTVEAVSDPSAPTGINIIRLTRNAADATTRGVELEFTALPLEGLQISGSIGLLDARYGTYIIPNPSSPGESDDLSGDRFANLPELQTFLAVQYSFPIETGIRDLDGWMTPRLEWAYESRMEFNGPDSPDFIQQGVNLINARLSYSCLDDRAQIALFARNLLSEEYFATVLPLTSVFGSGTRFFAPPRTWGGEISYRF